MSAAGCGREIGMRLSLRTKSDMGTYAAPLSLAPVELTLEWPDQRRRVARLMIGDQEFEGDWVAQAGTLKQRVYRLAMRETRSEGAVRTFEVRRRSERVMELQAEAAGSQAIILLRASPAHVIDAR